MLDSLLVLGQVPGTKVNITLNEVLLAAMAVGFISLFLVRHFSKKRRAAKRLAFIRMQAYLQLMNLGTTSERLTRHIVAVHRADTSSRRSYLGSRAILQAERNTLPAHYPLYRQAV